MDIILTRYLRKNSDADKLLGVRGVLSYPNTVGTVIRKPTLENYSLGIRKGRYPIISQYWERKGDYFPLLLKVFDRRRERKGIFIHESSVAAYSKGCILIGDSRPTVNSLDYEWDKPSSDLAFRLRTERGPHRILIVHHLKKGTEPPL